MVTTVKRSTLMSAVWRTSGLTVSRSDMVVVVMLILTIDLSIVTAMLLPV